MGKGGTCAFTPPSLPRFLLLGLSGFGCHKAGCGSSTYHVLGTVFEMNEWGAWTLGLAPALGLAWVLRAPHFNMRLIISTW